MSGLVIACVVDVVIVGKAGVDEQARLWSS